MEQEIKCPKCRGDKFTILNGNMVKCAYCGYVYKLPSQTASHQQAETKKRACPICGEQIDASLDVCPICGEHINPENAKPQPSDKQQIVINVIGQQSAPKPQATQTKPQKKSQTTESNQKKGWIAFASIVVLALIIAGIFVFSSRRENVTSASTEATDTVTYMDSIDHDYPTDTAVADEAVPDVDDDSHYVPNVDAAKYAIKAIYSDVIANWDNEPLMRSKYLSEAFLDFYNMMERWNEEHYPGEIGKLIGGCGLFTQNELDGSSNDIEVLEARYKSEYYMDGYYDITIRLWGRKIYVVLLDCGENGWKIDDINGLHLKIKTFLAQH